MGLRLACRASSLPRRTSSRATFLGHDDIDADAQPSCTPRSGPFGEGGEAAGSTSPRVAGVGPPPSRASSRRRLADPGIVNGQKTDPSWEPEFKREEQIHGCILITGNSEHTIQKRVEKIGKIFGSSMKNVKTVDGHVRPGEHKGQEHFGFEDGLSQPAIEGLRKPNTGEPVTSEFLQTSYFYSDARYRTRYHSLWPRR